MLYQAKLTGNRRDIHTMSPKALLIMINPANDLYRSHCWVDLSLVEHIQPEGHKPPILIKFTADKKAYLKRGTEQQYTLTNFTNIQMLP